MIRRRPDSCPIDGPSRAFTDAALGQLRAERWSPAGWARFAGAVSVRSGQQLAAHRRAAIEVSALHALFLASAVTRRRGLWWVAASWAMAVTHLGLLGDRRSIGWPNTVTLVRANLAVVGGPMGRWIGVAAIASDKLDGALACRQGPTMFGFYADSLADAAFWTWLASPRHESRLVAATSLAVWATPVVAVAAASITKGEMVARPRPALLRPAAAMQAVLAARVFYAGRAHQKPSLAIPRRSV